MLRVAAAPDCDAIHGRVSAVLCSLLHTLRARAPVIFCSLTEEILRLAQDLSDILFCHVSMLGGQTAGAQTNPLWPVTLKCFSISPDCASIYLTPSPLLLSSPAALETLVVVTLGVLTDALRGVVSRRDVGVAWETACSFLANGNTKLRKISMVMLRRMVELGGFPERRGQEFFTAYLQLLDMHFYIHNADAHTHKHIDEPYERELLNLTRCVFQSRGDSNMQTLGFEPILLVQLLECVCTLGGAGLRLGSEVTQSLCLLFSFLLSLAPGYESPASLRRLRVTEVCRTLTHTIGTGDQAEV